MYTLDTNAIIYFLKDEISVVSLFKGIFLQNVPLYISAITEIELFGFPKLTDTEAEQIEEILRTVAVIPVDSRIARIAGQIRRFYKLNIADSTIQRLLCLQELLYLPVILTTLRKFQIYLCIKFNELIAFGGLLNL